MRDDHIEHSLTVMILLHMIYMRLCVMPCMLRGRLSYMGNHAAVQLIVLTQPYLIHIENLICCTPDNSIWHSLENPFPAVMMNAYLILMKEQYLILIENLICCTRDNSIWHSLANPCPALKGASIPDTHEGIISDAHWKPYLLHTRQFYLTFIGNPIPGTHAATIPDTHEEPYLILIENHICCTRDNLILMMQPYMVLM